MCSVPECYEYVVKGMEFFDIKEFLSTIKFVKSIQLNLWYN